MAKLENYTGSVEMISGMKQKNGGDFPLMEAHSIQVDEDDKRLDEVLEELNELGLSVDEEGYIIQTIEEVE